MLALMLLIFCLLECIVLIIERSVTHYKSTEECLSAPNMIKILHFMLC